MTKAWLLALTLPLLAAAPATAGQTLVICNVGGPGTTRQAQPVLDKFLRHMERSGALASGTFRGEYHTDLDSCLKYIEAHKPLLGVFDLASYLAQQRALKLAPLASMGKMGSQRYYLLVRKGSYKDLAALEGKQLISSHVRDPRFVSRIVLDGKVDADKHFKIKYSRRPLKGIRRVARKRADATLVGKMAFDHLSELKLDVELVPVYTSPPLPGLTLATLGTARQKRTITAAVKKALPRLCSGPGKKMCGTFQIEAFHRSKPAAYRRLVRKYRR